MTRLHRTRLRARPPRSMSTADSVGPSAQAAADGLDALGAAGRAGDGHLHGLGANGVDGDTLELGVEFSKASKLYLACRRRGINLQPSVLVRAHRAVVAQHRVR